MNVWIEWTFFARRDDSILHMIVKMVCVQIKLNKNWKKIKKRIQFWISDYIHTRRAWSHESHKTKSENWITFHDVVFFFWCRVFFREEESLVISSVLLSINERLIITHLFWITWIMDCANLYYDMLYILIIHINLSRRTHGKVWKFVGKYKIQENKAML